MTDKPITETLPASIPQPRKLPLRRALRADITPEELARLEEYGSIEFASAGATRKR